jgi:hypothetical protein
MAPNGGNVEFVAASVEGMLARMSDVYSMHSLNISGESGAHVAAGFLRVPAWKTGEYAHAFHNPSTEAAVTIIVKNRAESGAAEVTITLGPSQFTPKLPRIEYIKVSGTSNGLVVLTQKYE